MPSKMSANLEWFQKTVRDLPTQLDAKEVVSSIKIALSGLNSTERKQIAENVQLSEVFECINSTDSEQVAMAGDVLKILLEVLDPSVVLGTYGKQITRALLHPNVPVKEVILQELYRAAGEDALIPVLGELEGLLPGAAECMAHEEMSVASKSIKFFVRLGQSVSGLSLIYGPPSVEILRKLMFTSDEVRFRVYEIASELSAKPLGLEVGHNSGILPSLLQELKKDDVLLKMTTLELLSKLAETEHGFGYLKSHSVLTKLAEDIVEAQNDPLASILLPGFMKFFGNLGHRWPDFLFNSYPNVVEIIFVHVDSDDPNTMSIAIETVGYIAATPQGKEVLNNKAALAMKHLAERIMEVVSKMPSDYRVRALNTITNIIALKEEEQNEKTLSLSQEWFQCLGKVEETMEHILMLCRQPFPEIHLAALQLVQAMVTQKWGQQYIRGQPGLIEVILDRDSKLQLESKKAKFEVIKTLAESPLTASVFGEDMLKEFKIFVKEGVIFVPVQTEIAFEGAS